MTLPYSDPSFADRRQRRATDTRVRIAQVREYVVSDREATVQLREEAAALREDMANAETGRAVAVQADVREANQNLLLASLDALQQKEQALLTKAQQEEFLAMLAHELRNPMAPIRSAAKILSKENLPPEMVSMLTGLINRQVSHMARLMDDLLDASRVTSGKFHLQRSNINIREPLNEALEQCRSLIEEHGHTLSVSLPREECVVDADPARLTQVFANLLNNAAKYTEPGGRITIAAKLVDRSVTIQVTDTGVGISPTTLPDIFEPFRQDERSIIRSQGGLGLGLSIVQKIVQLHGGTVKAESEGLGKGSRFTVVFPLAASLVETSFPPAAVPELPPLLFMLVDDNVDACTTLGILLELAGHQVIAAHDGPSAIDLFSRQNPDVVLCDIDLPGMTGYQVARRLRELSNDRKLVLVALTGYGGEARIALARAAGFDGQLVKPVDLDEVLLQVAAAGS